MSQFSRFESAPGPDFNQSGAGSLAALSRSHVSRAILTSLVYFGGGHIDLLLGWKTSPAALWPPNGILLSALLLAPTRTWWLYFLAVLPADLAISRLPLGAGLQLYAANSMQSLISAGLVRASGSPGRPMDDIPSLLRFVVFCVLLGPLNGALLGAAAIGNFRHGSDYWLAFRGWFLANALTTVWLVPAITILAEGLHWGGAARRYWRKGGVPESLTLYLGLLIVVLIVFEVRHPGSDLLGVYLYAPLPFLVWAAVRLGPRGVSMALLLVVLLAIHGVVHGRGPFAIGSDSEKVLQLQLVLLAMSLPLLFLGVEVRERGRAIAALQASERERIRTEEELRESFAEVRDLAGRLINAQESERARIARDLHDDLSQQLAGMSIGLSALKRGVSGKTEEEVSRLQEAAVQLAGEVRSLSHELHPGVLQHAGLTAALRARCAELSTVNGCKVEFESGEQVDGAASEVSLCLYRVAQEALGNVFRHAEAHSVCLAVRRVAGEIELTVRDDGRGFNPAQARARGGLGLISLEERVRMLRGKLFILSEPQRGTEVRVRVPVENGESHGTK